MTILGVSFEHFLRPNLRILITPLLLAIIILFLGIFIVKNGMERITIKLEELDNLESTVITLQEKVDILREIEGIILSHADTSVVAVPQDNSTLIMLTHLSSVANEKLVQIINKKTQSQQIGEEGLASAKININTTSDFNSILDYLMNLDDLAPLSTIDEVDMSKNGENTSGNLALSVYWGDFPTRIPAITEPIINLTAEEEDLINRLAKLKRPDFIELVPTAPTNRENPFR